MTQQPVSERDAALENAWANIMFDRWDQMAWFVKLANTAMATLHPGDILNLQGQCEAIRKVPISFRPIPSDRKRYPFHGGGWRVHRQRSAISRTSTMPLLRGSTILPMEWTSRSALSRFHTQSVFRKVMRPNNKRGIRHTVYLPLPS